MSPPIRWFVARRLRHQLAGTLEAVLTVEIRRAVSADAPAIAGVHVASFTAAHRGLVPLDHVTVERRESAWRDILVAAPGDGATLVAERAGRLVGFCHVATPSRDADADLGTAELTSIYVDPEEWRCGTGAALLNAAIDDLRADGWRQLTLWVLEANEPAQSFYSTGGLGPDGAEKIHQPSGQREVRLRRAIP